MTRGRPRTPTKIKIIRHTFRKDRSKNEPQPEVLTRAPDPPRGMPRAGRQLWKRAAAELVPLGLLTTVDVHLFEKACRYHGHAAELDYAITHVKDDAGKTRRQTLAEYLHETFPLTDASGNPVLIDGKPVMLTRVSRSRLGLARLMRELDVTAARILADFGFTPAARSRLDLEPGEKLEPSPIKRMMNEA